MATGNRSLLYQFHDRDHRGYGIHLKFFTYQWIMDSSDENFFGGIHEWNCAKDEIYLATALDPEYKHLYCVPFFNDNKNGAEQIVKCLNRSASKSTFGRKG
uniref:Uncharacterized protein n=1 Tax=Romanomermis culicivorax TaxID=13658 RepID=A0A915L8A9_ROMCU